MDQYDPRIARLLGEIAQTPSGWPLVDWVRLHWPRIRFGQPPSGLGAFCYPWPLAQIIIKDAWGEDWQRKTLAHELAHMIRWRGHLVGSLEQEYDAYLTEAKVRCEWEGWNWMEPDEQAVKNYPLFFGPAANKDEYKRQLRQRAYFYSILPWDQPRHPLEIARAMSAQAAYGVRSALGLLEKKKGGAKEQAKKSV